LRCNALRPQATLEKLLIASTQDPKNIERGTERDKGEHTRKRHLDKTKKWVVCGVVVCSGLWNKELVGKRQDASRAQEMEYLAKRGSNNGRKRREKRKVKSYIGSDYL
jgi:hypothetical protein